SAFQQDALGQHTGFQLQIFSMQHRLQKSARGTPTPPAFLIDVEVTASLIVAAIEIFDFRNAGFSRRIAYGFNQFPFHARKFDPPLAANRMMFPRAEKMILMLLEDWQHIVPSPTGKTELAPVVV